MTISASMLSDAMISANVLIEKLLGLGRVPDEVYPRPPVIERYYANRIMGIPVDNPDYWVTGTATGTPLVFSLHETQPDRCPYCGSKSTNDERGNCAACGGPR